MGSFYEFAESMTVRKYIPAICGFKEWLISESQTVAQYLQQQTQQYWGADNMREIKQGVRDELMKVPSIKGNQKFLDRFTNYFTYLSLDQMKGTNTGFKNRAGATVRRHWQQWGDYFVANAAQVFNKLNTVEYTPNVVDQEVSDWHQELATKHRSLPSEQFVVALTLDHIGWPGWQWVDLERGACDEEGEAMGHCGNAAVAEGDTIFSLRAEDKTAHLTFIVNDKVLGEAKGRGNTKPSNKYHPAIVELLKSQFIDTIRGGGYLPENNFVLEDLPKAQQKQLLEQKPYLNDFFGYLIENNRIEDIGTMIGASDLKYDKKKDEFIIRQYGEASEMKELVREKRHSNESGDFTYYLGDEMYDWDTGPVDVRQLVRDSLTEEIEARLTAHFEKALGDEFEDDDLDDMVEEDDDVADAFRHAHSDGVIAGTQNEAWRHISQTLQSGDENGFYINMDSKEHPFELRISKENLRSFFKEAQEDIEYQDDITQLVDFDYTPPYYGYSDFDEEAFQERLDDLLHELGI